VTDPPSEAYGRVTNPERYRVVHDAARALVDHLRRDFVIETDDAPPGDPILLASGASIEEIVRVVPEGTGAAPITFALTDFPGVLVRTGRWQCWAYPSCGCDACDEDPADSAARLRSDVEAVTAGRMHEEWDGERLHISVRHADGSGSSGWTLVDRDRPSYGGPHRYDWRPWRPR
jgi:hypothetical protein